MDQHSIIVKLSQMLNENVSFAKGCHDIATEIKERHSRLLELVEGLHSVLTDTRPNVREKGVRILAQVLQLLPNDLLTEGELSFILQFFTDRLKDHHSVIPATLQGILSVLQMQHVPSKLPDNLLTEMSQHVSCQAQLQSDRCTIYNIINLLVQRYSNDLMRLGPDFLSQVISNIDGEKDPHNLMFLFRMMPGFLEKFPLGHLAEDMFAVLSCYFPIDYYSGKNNRSRITREQLAVALASCLTAVEEFSVFCFPLIFEKLDSTLKEAKLDCYYLLKIWFYKFPAHTMEDYLSLMWENIKSEVLPGIDKEIREAALETLGALVHSLCASPVSREHANLCKDVVQGIITDTQPSLKEVEMNAFLPSVRLLLCVAEAAVPACIQVITNIVPVLLTQYYTAPNNGQKVSMLQAITSLLAVCNATGAMSDETQELEQIIKEVNCLYIHSAMTEDEELLKEAIHGFTTVITSLEIDHRCKLYDILAACLKQHRNKALWEEAVFCLKKLARQYSDEVMNAMVLRKLKVFEGGGDANFDQVYECCELALCEIADVEPFTTFIVPQFLDLVIGSHDFKKQLIGISCLRKLVEVPGEDSSMHNFLHERCAAVSCLVTWCFQSAKVEELCDALHHVEFLALIAKVLECIVRKQIPSIQAKVVLQFVPWFLHPEAHFDIEKAIWPLNSASPAHHTQLVILLEGLLASIRQEVNLDHREELIHILTVLGIETTNTLTHRSACRLVGNLINKASNDSLSKSLETISAEIMRTVKCDTSNLMKKHAVWLQIWVTKALIMRSHKDVDSWISSLIKVLHDDLLSAEGACGFGIIMKEDEEFMTQNNFCNIRLLFKQRMFMITHAKLVESHHSAVTVTAKCNHLLSLMHILQGVPRQVLLADMPKVIPLLVESLTQQNVPLLLSTLETLRTLLEERQLHIMDYMNTFINKFLLLSQFEQSMKVRILALQCLYLLCFYPTESILLYKDQIVRELCKCLDDKKRLVRLQAVRARSRWFVVGSPGEPSKS